MQSDKAKENNVRDDVVHFRILNTDFVKVLFLMINDVNSFIKYV